ncbi:hypothetical protein OOZ15_14350 [Galbibacter sp. EGI 63066]|uniref:DUF3108 domain-containing protein n=1 Tax=Galbibacter sp. EGI 63066 TaxID=2993559 RepID=UPI002248A654|nr:hypothetical protein [Galbibacter sp. EGI 63066]MCX2681129.1 hypothetical protein [Galbibacter sp. EGI 63066]
MRIKNFILLIVVCVSIQAFSQKAVLNPDNNPADKKFVADESSEMTWFMLQDTVKIEIGKVFTKIEKNKKEIVVITTVDMKQTASKWTDTTVVETANFKPVYHSSYNQQRDMVLNFGKAVTGYYLDKKTGTKTTISEKTEKSYFDSNFYPQLIRCLPLEEDYSTVISIFDYNPKAKTGVITATVKSVEKTSMRLNEQEHSVWKVQSTDDISKNTAISTYYIDDKTRKILKQNIDFNGRKMSMELNETF